VASPVKVGTASWTEPTLIKLGSFYPKGANTPEERLRFYASQFDVVEVDSTYYALPSRDNSIRWVERTPEHFTFDFKAFRLFTQHQTPVSALPKDIREEAEKAANSKGNLYYKDLPPALQAEMWQRFKDGVEPLKAAGRLGYILIQLPPWAMKNSGNLRHLEECAGQLEGYTLAVEFRNKTWLEEKERREVLGFLREQNLALVTVDEPQGTFSSVPDVWEATSPDLAVVRFHGHNLENWTKKNITAAERFDYLYSEEELSELASRVKQLRERTAEVHAMFNNCYSDKATTNARQFANMLGHV
jgi:uncharacterized protein YecE (DUF72 family)